MEYKEIEDVEKYIRDNNYKCQYDKKDRKIIKDRDFNYYELLKEDKIWIKRRLEMNKRIEDYRSYKLIKMDVERYIKKNRIEEGKIEEIRIEYEGYEYNNLMEEYVDGVSYEELCMYRLYIDREGEMTFEREKGIIKIIIDYIKSYYYFVFHLYINYYELQTNKEKT